MGLVTAVTAGSLFWLHSSVDSPGLVTVTRDGFALWKLVVTQSCCEGHVASSLGVTGVSEEERSW